MRCSRSFLSCQMRWFGWFSYRFKSEIAATHRATPTQITGLPKSIGGKPEKLQAFQDKRRACRCFNRIRLQTLYAHAHSSYFDALPACHSGGNLKVIRLRVPLSATAKGNRTPTPCSGLTIPVGSLISLSKCFPRMKHTAEHEPELKEFGSVDWEDERAAKKAVEGVRG